MNLFLFFMTTLVLAGNALVDVCGMGGRGPGLLPAGRLLVQTKPTCCGRGQEGFRRQPRWRFRISDRDLSSVGEFWNAGLLRRLRQSWRRDPGWTGGVAYGDGALFAPGRNRKICAVAALYLAAGCDGGPDAGFRVDSCGDDGDGGRLHDRAFQPDLQRRRPPRSSRSPSSARSRCCSARSSGAPRTTSRRRSPGRRCRRSAT